MNGSHLHRESDLTVYLNSSSNARIDQFESELVSNEMVKVEVARTKNLELTFPAIAVTKSNATCFAGIQLV